MVNSSFVFYNWNFLKKNIFSSWLGESVNGEPEDTEGWLSFTIYVKSRLVKEWGFQRSKNLFLSVLS